MSHNSGQSQEKEEELDFMGFISKHMQIGHLPLKHIKVHFKITV